MNNSYNSSYNDLYADYRLSASEYQWVLYQYSVIQMVRSILGIFITGSLVIYGAITNIINVAVFYRQGIFSDSCTVSLTALAISDFFCCAFTIFGCYIAYLKIFTHEILHVISWVVSAYENVFSRIPVMICVQWSSLITCNLSLERCISVLLPFRVKQIFTPRKTAITNFCFLLLTVILYFPEFADYYMFSGKHFSENRTIHTFLLDEDMIPTAVETVANMFIHSFVRPASIIFVLICNSIIIRKVRSSRKFKASHTQHTSRPVQDPAQIDGEQNRNAGNRETDTAHQRGKGKGDVRTNMTKAPHSILSKDQNILRMVNVLSFLYVICYSVSPLTVIYRFLRQFDFARARKRFFSLEEVIADEYLNIFIRFFDIFIATVNINIYLSLSSRYRKEFKKLFCKSTPDTN